MCSKSTPATPFEVNGYAFAVDACPKHLHAYGGLVMPSGGSMTLFATAVEHDELVKKIASLLADALDLAKLEFEHPGTHPFDLIAMMGGRVRT